MIEVKNLVKKYGSHLAVDDISFTVEPGHIYGFLGPNGAGKSTTMNVMTGYIGATSGNVIINGHDILEEPEKAKSCIGYLPELPPLYMDMTVEEYLKFVAELKSIPKKEIKGSMEEVCSMIRLEEVRGRMIKNLSKGYKQRVGLAGAIIGFPEIIILDEPMVGLDPKQIIEIRELIRELSKKHTIILSSHILAEVKEMCDYIIIISKGKIVASDTPDNLESNIYSDGTIELEVRTNEKEATKILKSVSGIESYTCKAHDGYLEIILKSTGKNEKICEDLSTAFVKNNSPLKKLHTVKATLEDVFLELTSQASYGLEDSEEANTEVNAEVEGDTDVRDL